MQQQMNSFGGQPNMMGNMPANFLGGNKNTLFNMANMAGLRPGGGQPKKRFDNACTLNVSNLSHTTFDNDLFKHFSSKGYKVASVRVMIDNMTMKSKCFGYLNFHTAEEASRCLSEMNSTTLDGKQLILNKKKDADVDSQANLLIKNLPKEMNQVEFVKFFNEFGEIVSCKLEQNADGTSKCFGYVQYSKPESAKAVIDKWNGKEYQGKELMISILSKKTEREETADKYTNLHVMGIPAGTTEKQLKDLFSECGEVISVKIKDDKSEQGFVQYKNHEEAVKAVETFSAKKELNGKVIFVSKHISKQENSHGQKMPPITQALKETFQSNVYVRFIPKDTTED